MPNLTHPVYVQYFNKQHSTSFIACKKKREIKQVVKSLEFQYQQYVPIFYVFKQFLLINIHLNSIIGENNGIHRIKEFCKEDIETEKQTRWTYRSSTEQKKL